MTQSRFTLTDLDAFINSPTARRPWNDFAPDEARVRQYAGDRPPFPAVLVAYAHSNGYETLWRFITTHDDIFKRRATLGEIARVLRDNYIYDNTPRSILDRVWNLDIF